MYLSNFLFFIPLLLVSCESKYIGTIQIDGKTMGTTYLIKISDFNKSIRTTDQIKYKVDSTLTSINLQMSTYLSGSEISKFNQMNVRNISPSEEFLVVLEYARDLSESSKGLFDITVAPLVQLWGFANKSSTWEPPQSSDINQLLKNIGNDTWQLSDGEIIKLNPNIQIDVNAIAKGFGVDKIATLIESMGYNDFMIEIGGEVYCSGKNEKDEFWRIGVELPDFNSRKINKIVNLSNAGMATSGDYRNYFSYNGKNYSHTINPKTGTSIDHSMASATVISETCMNADGLATALLVMGTDKALDYIENTNSAECLLIERNGEGDFRTFMSSGFDDYLLD